MGARGHSSAHRLIDVPGKGRQGVPKGGFSSPASADRISGLASRRSWLMCCSANIVRGEALSNKAISQHEQGVPRDAAPGFCFGADANRLQLWRQIRTCRQLGSPETSVLGPPLAR